jgi:hypothetical protein
MLQSWQTHQQYQKQLLCSMTDFYQSDPDLVLYYQDQLNNLYELDLDPVRDLLQDYYSNTGAPARLQAQLLRSYFLMSKCQTFSIPAWVKRLSASAILRAAAGYQPGDPIHQVGSYYDLVDRIWGADPVSEHEFEHSFHPFHRKPKKKYGKNEKQPVRRPGIVQKLADVAAQGRVLEKRPERLMQQIFAKAAAEPAVRQGLFGDPQKLVVSGDGTCVLSGGSAWGSKQCSCREQGIYNCDCPRIFSDPFARYGWDSYHNSYFYGHTAYILAVYNPDLKCDLPIYLRMVQANRHDSVSSIVALSEFRSLYPDVTIDTFCGDCAHDAIGIYRLLEHWKIKAVIPLKSNTKADQKQNADYTINEKGVPVCQAGLPMVNWGFNPEKRRRKFRCPLACGRIDHCDHKEACHSDSAYGRTIYVTQHQNLRFATRIRRGSAQWKAILRSRTASERFNKRLLNDYGLEKHKARGNKRIFWWSLVHATNILLDAARKLNRPTFVSILTAACAA